jgi:hypothetical protein
VVAAPTKRNEQHPTTTTRTEDEGIYNVTNAPPEATSHKIAEMQRNTDKTRNKSGDIIPQPHDIEHTTDKEGRQVVPETVDGTEKMYTTENQEEDKCAHRAGQGGEDPQPQDTLYEAQSNDPHDTKQKPKRESEEGMEVHEESASTQPDKRH